ncbi:MAG: hypothetical protein ACK53L_34735 [Pirellulaceae bacterium]
MMAVFNKFNAFVENLAEGVHNLQSHTLKVMLTNTAPVATNSVRADLTEIAAGNGYAAGGIAPAITSSGQTSGTYKLVLADVVFTASGGSIGPFRYAVLYNDTPTSPADPLIGWWDYGSALTVLNGESLNWDADPTNGVLTLF